jgi:hypothetical protein
MSLPLIRAALEQHLAAMTPALSTAYENVQFSSTGGVPYQRVNLMTARPDNSTMGALLYRELGIFQVSLCYPLNSGPAAAEARAQLIRVQFKRGTTLTNGAITVNVTETPAISNAMVDTDRYVIPVSIPWQSYVMT